MKKIILYAVIGVVCVILIIKGVQSYNSYFIPSNNSEYTTQLDYFSQNINKKHPAEVIWIGNTSEFIIEEKDGKTVYSTSYLEDVREMPVRVVTDITLENLKPKTKAEVYYIVVNDIYGDVEITEEELQLLYNMVLANAKYYFLYCGTKETRKLEKLGLLDMTCFSSDCYSVMYHKNKDEIWAVTGNYDKNTYNSGIPVMVSLLIHHINVYK